MIERVLLAVEDSPAGMAAARTGLLTRHLDPDSVTTVMSLTALDADDTDGHPG